MSKYPIAPDSFDDDARKAWNGLIKQLELNDTQNNQVAGTDYTVSGTVTVAVTIDLGAAGVTAAVVQGFAKLLKDLKNKSIINVKLVS